MTARQEIFLAIVIGGVATPASTNIIIAMDGAKAIYSGLLIVYKSKRITNFNTEGIYLHTYFKTCLFATEGSDDLLQSLAEVLSWEKG